MDVNRCPGCHRPFLADGNELCPRCDARRYPDAWMRAHVFTVRDKKQRELAGKATKPAIVQP